MNWRQQIRDALRQRDDEIVAMRRQKMTLKQIGDKVSLSAVMVLKILRHHGEAPLSKKERSPENGSARLAQRIAEIHPEMRAS